MTSIYLKLKALNLANNCLKSCDLTKLTGFNKLKELNLNHTRLSESQLAKYLNKLANGSQLTSLSIANNPNLASVDFKALAKLTSLEYLNLANTNFSREDLNYLIKNAKFRNTLKRLNLDNCNLKANVNSFFNCISNFPQLKDLSINGLFNNDNHFLLTAHFNHLGLKQLVENEQSSHYNPDFNNLNS